MTEEEAKTKWCPFGRIWSDSGAAYNRTGQAHNFDGPSVNSLCLGSACMAWRWEKQITNKVEIQRAVQMMQVGSGYHQIDPEFANTDHGYCGLAEKP